MRLVLALCCAAHAFVGPQRSAPPRLQATAQEISAKTEGTETVFSLEEVQKILPHRYPFALVDKVIEYEAGKSAVGVKCVTFNEPQFTGHFPDRPIMPGVMQIEALAQLARHVVLAVPRRERRRRPVPRLQCPRCPPRLQPRPRRMRRPPRRRRSASASRRTAKTRPRSRRWTRPRARR